ncbi:MAG: hypothetical protein O7B99_06130 [Planctomycetota bacterium]|nr:hypothetical protein [Planctomycetota bacterium]
MAAERDRERLEAWLDGGLEPRERETFERRLAADPELAAEAGLQEAIDAALRRGFTPPEDAGTPVLAFMASARRRRAAGGFLALAAAAAGLLGLTLEWPGGEEEPPAVVDVGHSEDAGGAPAQEPAGIREFLTENPPEPLASPNLLAMYASATEGAAAAAPPGKVGVCEPPKLAESLGRQYDQCLIVQPPDTAAFVGPFTSPEWPTATLFVAYSSDTGEPSLVAVDQNVACGFPPRLPASSGLSFFQRSVGNVMVSEVTPLSEPRYLEAFQTCEW